MIISISLLGSSDTNMQSKPSMALIADRPGKSVILPGLPGAYAPGGPSMARIPSCDQTIRLIATWYEPALDKDGLKPNTQPN
ncbi:MAG: hypothetical protein HY910_13810 [Desulfarculus sp.]|nr:hypothetical protein [Desulfarculus sp.]